MVEFPTSGERLSTCIDRGNMWSLVSFLAQNRVALRVMLPPIHIMCSAYLHLLPSEFPIWMISARESSHLSNGVSNYEGLPSFLPTFFSLFPSQNPSPQEFRSLQDLRCSDSIWISSTKTWEQNFPRFTPSALPRDQCYHLLSILHCSLRPFYTEITC
jgi:hypothetical protein